MIKIQRSDGIDRVYDNHKYVGYLDSAVLYMFDEKGYAEECGWIEELSGISDHVRKYQKKLTERMIQQLKDAK